MNNFTSLKELVESRPGATFSIENYLGCEESNLPKINNLEKMAESIIPFLVGNDIVVYSDYDVDGVFSAIIMFKALTLFIHLESKRKKAKKSKIHLIVPNRLKDGYGFNQATAENTHNSLIILLDNGTAQKAEIETAKSNGNTVYVVDHHKPDGDLPNADIIINPHAVGGMFTEYCAAGLTYRLVRNLFSKLVGNNYDKNDLVDAMQEFLFLAGVATIADVVPVINENRLIVKHGLRNIPSDWRPFVNYLCDTDEDRDHVSEEEISYKVAPAVNASGRLGELDDKFVVAMALNKNGARDTCAKHVLRQNKARREKTKDGENKISKQLADEQNHQAIVVYNPEVEIGVVGIIAGHLSEKYNKPSFVFTRNEKGELVGSARTKSGTVNIKDLLDKVKENRPDVLLKYGGHDLAAGMTIESEDKFKEFLSTVYALVDGLKFDIESDSESPYDFNLPDEDWFDLMDQIEKYGPWGEGNPAPVYRTMLDLNALRVKFMNGQAVKITDERFHEYLGFGIKETIENDSLFIAYGVMNRNEWNGGNRIQFTIRNVEPQSLLAQK